jgi:hypothetical protein
MKYRAAREELGVSGLLRSRSSWTRAASLSGCGNGYM